jgi:transglutaminase-like putative cysteine protease
VQKAVLLAALARAAEIPAKVGFADVRNHLASPRLVETMKTDVFAFHGFVELHLDGRWVKATPAFDRRLCERHGVHPLEFDGRHDALFHPYDQAGQRHMEYIHQHGTFADLPLELMLETMRRHYPHFFEGFEAADDGDAPRS